MLREGAWADLVVFDPETVGETADFDDPYRYPLGIDHVYVNGVAAVGDGRLTGRCPGQVLRRAA